MAYPHIRPINIGRDGWSALYDTAASRLLYHCGLRPARIQYSSARNKSVIEWKLSADAAREAVKWHALDREIK